ncbi:MAG: tetratricopeptide repeat protein [Bacteroidia bacterium]
MRRALKQYQKALKLVEGIGDIEGMANAYANVGGTLHELERKEEAFPYLKKGLELARQSENASFIGGALALILVTGMYLTVKLIF